MSKKAISELIDGKVLVWKKSFLPVASGIYIVFDELDNVYYVGQSININKRWKEHSALVVTMRVGAYIGWLECDIDDLDRFEDYFIDLLNPCLNRGGYTPEYITEVNISIDSHLMLISYCLENNMTTKQVIDNLINLNIDEKHKNDGKSILKIYGMIKSSRRFHWA